MAIAQEKFMIKPTNPWQKKNANRSRDVAIASVAPFAITVLLVYVFSLNFALSAFGILLPLQFVAAALVGRKHYGKRGGSDAALMVFTIFFSALVAVLLLSVFFSVVVNGAQTISPAFISQNNVYISPTTSLEYGGAGHSIIGTILVVGLTTLFTVPLGVLIAIYLTETRGRARSVVRTLVQAMSGLPSVVAGLFVYSALIVTGVTAYAGWAGSLALMPLMLPTVTRIAEEALRLVPADLRNGALALGAPTYRAFFQVILPAAKTGLITAVLLGIARIIGETAPLLLTTFAANGTSFNVFSGPMSTLPTYLYQFISAGYDTSTSRAWGAALVIMLLVALLFSTARILGRDAKKPQRKKKG
jgi:phosphate transport system permease protein